MVLGSDPAFREGFARAFFGADLLLFAIFRSVSGFASSGALAGAAAIVLGFVFTILGLALAFDG